MTAPSFALALIFAILPPRPMALQFKNISLTAALNAAKLGGMKLELPFKVEGRVTSMRVEIRDHVTIARIQGVTLGNDSTQPPVIQSLTVHFNRKTGYGIMQGHMLGGIVEATGVWK
jgi:hypothetical protein